MMRRREKNVKIIALILLLILLISIGYAYLSSNLSIKGETTIKAQSWQIYFANLVENESGVTATTSPTINGTTTTELTYTVNLTTPGDFYEFTVDMVNDGTVDAVLQSFTVPTLTPDQEKYLSSTVTYTEDGKDLAIGDTLANKSSKNLTVRIEYLKDITADDLPTEDIPLELTLAMNYVAANEATFDAIITDKIIAGYSWWKPSTVETTVEIKENSKRATVSEPILMSTGDSFTVKQTSSYCFGYLTLEKNEDGTYSQLSDAGWQTAVESQDVTYTATSDCYVVLNFKTMPNEQDITDTDVAAIKELITFQKGSTDEGTGYSTTQELLASETTVATYDKCLIVTVPSTLSNGTTIVPHVGLTAATEGGKDIKSTLTYATENNYAVVMNAGLFDTTTLQPIGQTIIKGVSKVNTPRGVANGETVSDVECYPLAISKAGALSAPYDKSIDTATMINDGAYYAITGWMTIIEDGAAKYENYDDIEIVHPGEYTRQVIGQYTDGDYFILTTTGDPKTVGMTYSEIATLLLGLEKPVKFAYSLDGGGSAETVVDKTQLNPIYEGTVGRSVPSVIYFDEMDN